MVVHIQSRGATVVWRRESAMAIRLLAQMRARVYSRFRVRTQICDTASSGNGRQEIAFRQMNTRYASRIPFGTTGRGSRATEQIVNHVTRTMPLTHSPLPFPANYHSPLTLAGFTSRTVTRVGLFDRRFSTGDSVSLPTDQ